MVPMQLSLCLLFVPMDLHNRVLKMSSSSTHKIRMKQEKMKILSTHWVTTEFWLSNNWAVKIWGRQDYDLTIILQKNKFFKKKANKRTKKFFSSF